MMERRRLISVGALALGAILFISTLYFIDFQLLIAAGRRLGAALVLSILISGLWHLARTWAWSWCFPQPRSVSFLRLARVRLAAEAFSYLTLRGIAGEPLKVVLFADDIDPRIATAAVARAHRLRSARPSSSAWVDPGDRDAADADMVRVFRAFAIAAGVVRRSR